MSPPTLLLLILLTLALLPSAASASLTIPKAFVTTSTALPLTRFDQAELEPLPDSIMVKGGEFLGEGGGRGGKGGGEGR